MCRLKNKATMTKRVILMVAMLAMGLSAGAQMQALFGYSTFYLPAENRPYMETYLQVDAWTVAFEELPNGAYRGTVEVTLVVRKQDSVYYVKKYDLNSPTVGALDELDFSFMDLQRFAIGNGLYTVELTLRDKVAGTEPATVEQKVLVDYADGRPALSSLRLIAEATPTQGQGTIFSRNGYDMEPYVSDFYPKTVDELHFYYEIYNIDNEVGSRPLLTMAYLEQQETGARVEGFQVVARKQSAQSIPVFGSMDISELPSGNYNLVVEARNRDNQTMLIARTPVYRSNPGVKGAPISDFATTFVGKYTSADELNLYIDALMPIASESEKSVGKAVMRGNSIEEKQAFLYRFWTVRSPAPEAEWLKYKELIDYVQANFSYPKTPGIHTDQGRIYLRFGPPDYVRDEKNFVSANRIGDGYYASPHQDNTPLILNTDVQQTANVGSRRSLGQVHYLPYILWRYDHPKNDDPKRVFIFWDEHRSGFYQLLHSNARGEIMEHGWERRLCRNQIDEGVVGEVGEQFNRGY